MHCTMVYHRCCLLCAALDAEYREELIKECAKPYGSQGQLAQPNQFFFGQNSLDGDDGDCWTIATIPYYQHSVKNNSAAIWCH